jgi:hypothetical protein
MIKICIGVVLCFCAAICRAESNDPAEAKHKSEILKAMKQCEALGVKPPMEQYNPHIKLLKCHKDGTFDFIFGP